MHATSHSLTTTRPSDVYYFLSFIKLPYMRVLFINNVTGRLEKRMGRGGEVQTSVTYSISYTYK